jgi:hypothetical protein
MTECSTVTEALPARDRTLAREVLAWTAEYLRQPDGPGAGEPWVFTAEQARIVARWYGIDGNGRFLFRRGVLRRMKGWGKDPFLAALAAAELCGPCRFAGFDAEGLPVGASHPSAWVQVAAVSQEQTRNTMTLLPGLFSSAAIDEFRIDLGKTIVYAGRSGRIEAVTSSPRALEGGRPSMVIANESQEWLRANEGHAMADVIRRNLAKSNDGSARSMEICNAHRPGEESVAEITYEAWLKANGDVPGLYYDSLEAPAVKDLADRPRLRKALLVARGDSSWVDVDRLCDEIADPATAEHVARRYYLNHVVAVDSERWLPAGAWKQAAKPDRDVSGESVVLGFDGSYRRDATALVGCTLNGRLFVVRVWERPEHAPPDWKVPREEVHATLADAMERLDVVELAPDPPGWHAEIEEWEDTYGGVVVRFDTNQPSRMCPAVDRFRSALMEGAIEHDANVVLTRHIGNCVAKETRAGTALAKPDQGRKIDAAVAAVVAYERAMFHASNGPAEPLVAWR